MATKISTKEKSTTSPIFADDDFLVMAAGQGSGGSGNNGGGIGGGGGSPGGGTPGGGGGNGGKPGGETFGNNLSFPAVFFEQPTWLRAVVENGSPEPTKFTFTTPTYLTGDDHAYFAQGVEGNVWQAGSLASTEPVVVDYVDIGDALETAPIKAGTNLRLELTLYEALDDTLTAFEITVLGGAKGGGKPTVKGPTESQGARMGQDDWAAGGPNHTWDRAYAPDGTTFESEFASIYAGKSGTGETADSYMSMSIQTVTGVETVDDLLAALDWNGAEWQGGGDGVTVGDNIFNTSFGPELNIGGKYIMGASGKPFKFTSDGDYLITFAIEDNAPLSFDGNTQVANDDAVLNQSGFQPDPYDALEDAYRETWVVPDGDGHNGLLVMLVGVPSSVETGEG